MDADRTDILVVDDLPEKHLAYGTILDDLPVNIVTARSGEEALRHVLRTDFAVVLMDVNMPGMDGFEAASLIRQRKRSAHTPIIFLTAFADEVRAAEGYAHGAVDYIPTPVVPAVLRAKVRVFVDLYRMTQRVKAQAEERVALAEEQTRRAAAEEATRRLGFLADVSRALADSLDPDTTARTVARQAVPFLADLASVTLAGEPGRPWRTKLAWAGSGGTEAKWLTSEDAPRDELRDAVERVLAGGPAESLDDLDLAFPPAPAPTAGHARTAAVVPLRARGRILGALVLAYGPSGRRHDATDLALAGDLAGRAAIALDNARLYQNIEHADRQKNEFLSMLAHELRNPLAPIRNAADILRMKAADRPDLHPIRDIIERQVRHMVRLVDDLLDVSRITRGKITLRSERVDLKTVVGLAVEASQPMVDRLGHQLDVTAPATPVWVVADPARVAQVVTNLLNNAAKYTEAGGHIRLTVSRDGADAVVRVHDTGMGIPPEMLGAVFELFTQVDRTLERSQGGLGVGLTLVRRLVEMHGGTVAAHSDGPGTGSEFVVRLPVTEATAVVGGPPADAARPAPPAALRVLVVDDNVDAAESLVPLLRALGYEARTAHDGEAGAAAAVEYRPDVVLLDIGLPRLDGYAVARRLRERPETRGCVLVALTGYARDEDRARAAAAGFDHHLTKPVEFAALRDLLATLRPRAA